MRSHHPLTISFSQHRIHPPIFRMDPHPLKHLAFSFRQLHPGKNFHPLHTPTISFDPSRYLHYLLNFNSLSLYLHFHPPYILQNYFNLPIDPFFR